MADPKPVEPVVVEPSRADEDNEHDAMKEESHQESGDTKPPKESETPKIAITRKPRADETLQTDSKVSVFKRKELKDEHDQTSLPPGSNASSGSNTRKQSHSSQQQSHQSADQQSRKSSKGPAMGEAEVKEDVSWISRRTGKMMQCKSQQTSAVWEKRPLADILHPKSKSADRDRICGFTEEKSDQWVSKSGKLVRNTSQQTNRAWERKPLADILLAGNKEIEAEEQKAAPAEEKTPEEAEAEAAEAEEAEAKEEAPPAEEPAEESVPAESEAEKPEEAQPEVQEAEPEKQPEEEPPQEEKPEEQEPEKKEEEVKEEEPKEEEPPETRALEAEQPEPAEKAPSQITRVVSAEDVTFTNGRTGAEVKNVSQQTSESLFVDYLTKIYGKVPSQKLEDGGAEGEVAVVGEPRPEEAESQKSIQYLEMRESQILAQDVETKESKKSMQEPEAQEPSQEPEAQEPEAQEPEAQEPEAEEPSHEPEAEEPSQEPEVQESKKSLQEPEEKKSKKSIEEKTVEEPEIEEPPKNIEEMEVEEPLKSAKEPDLLSEKGKDESQKEMEKEGEMPPDEEFDKTESQATLDSMCSYVDGEDKALQTYSIISLEDGIWLNRKTGKFLVSRTQQTSETLFMTPSQIALKDAPPKIDEKRLSAAAAESKPEEQPSSGKSSKQVSRQGSRQSTQSATRQESRHGSQQGSRPESRHGSQQGSRPESPRHGSQQASRPESRHSSQPASRKGSRTESQTASRKGSRTGSQTASRKGSSKSPSHQDSKHETQAAEHSEGEEHGPEDVEKILSRRLSEATLQSLEALDAEETKSVRTYSSINSQEGTWVNNRTGRQLATQAQQTELSCFSTHEGDNAPPEEK